MRNRRESLWWFYRSLWHQETFVMLMLHIIVASLLLFVVSFAYYNDGRASVYWPALGIALAFLACMGLFVDLNNWPTGGR